MLLPRGYIIILLHHLIKHIHTDLLNCLAIRQDLVLSHSQTLLISHLRVESPLNAYFQLFIGLTKVCEPADIHYRVLMATERGSDCENRRSVDFASGFSELLGNYVGLRDK